MFSGKKCQRCEGKIKDSFDFCPYCGLNLQNPEEDSENFGMLGKSNHLNGYPMVGGLGGLGITDKMINSIFKSLMKNLEGQMKESGNGNGNIPHEIENLPNGIKIKIGTPGTKTVAKKTEVKKNITKEQVDRMSKLPRGEAKTNVRRLSDKVIYELNASGVENPDDVFVSKLENGYEIKAIGKRKVYVNSIPVNLPLRGFSLNPKFLRIEFGLE